ncbi:hypothetical protein CKM354_000621100 [Cercospora kikuchii]|uniref:Uncharacterized protein n=1 Tax=Cercospora kikuchii TaxID=84275 RepID=A0A9P3CHG9_9PEZI|nr:uncharacterized protein CKM354_000621100 [Cercospora kikuchii]GIZ42964.1 hypothetical protein CKM354_000621100 [Cercospora kikuchii]
MHTHKLLLITIAATACSKKPQPHPLSLETSLTNITTDAAAIMRSRTPIAVGIAHDEAAKEVERRDEDAFYEPATQEEYIRTGPNIKEVAEKGIEQRDEDAFYVPATQEEYIRTGPNIKEIAE